jgi:hypothetical protein
MRVDCSSLWAGRGGNFRVGKEEKRIKSSGSRKYQRLEVKG